MMENECVENIEIENGRMVKLQPKTHIVRSYDLSFSLYRALFEYRKNFLSLSFSELVRGMVKEYFNAILLSINGLATFKEHPLDLKIDLLSKVSSYRKTKTIEKRIWIPYQEEIQKHKELGGNITVHDPVNYCVVEYLNGAYKLKFGEKRK